jgi:hypothetical protein
MMTKLFFQLQKQLYRTHCTGLMYETNFVKSLSHEAKLLSKRMLWVCQCIRNMLALCLLLILYIGCRFQGVDVEWKCLK